MLELKSDGRFLSKDGRHGRHAGGHLPRITTGNPSLPFPPTMAPFSQQRRREKDTSRAVGCTGGWMADFGRILQVLNWEVC